MKFRVLTSDGFILRSCETRKEATAWQVHFEQTMGESIVIKQWDGWSWTIAS